MSQPSMQVPTIRLTQLTALSIEPPFTISSLSLGVLSSLFAVIGGIKTVLPSFLSTYEGFTFGRIRMLNSTLIMGWCSNAILQSLFG